ncbi:ribosome recycling factor [Saccharopolyspora antimicrobica]|uniref:Ribosome-recycling factor n=2 Tax=Saccharopolyspora TaxID=1835 RepID=A0A1I4T1W8_9PSEU|nr:MULTISPECIES: ribosome recycling factor [Saccharopolyspora]RKT85905.1 ribosome recycling factor [Saccharopolyspora antimicrobica]SEG63351.1 ribosome recycling factor [Saccharopolyspora kobensis]SFC13473.1 ribosome recycling factor [Saccharopolyspora kobensis]SFM70758.1 ribosome recycling factor [Saccharopolyspora antimicrobica]
MIDEALLEGEEKMQKAVERAKDELATVRTGRANPAMFSGIVVDYYGSPTPLNQLASVSVPEARLVVVKPYDASQLAAMEKAIRDSDLGVNPSNDGQLIRIAIPQMTEERRKEMVKLAKQKGEDGKVSVRGIRRKVKEEIDRIVKDGEAGEDEGTRAEKELDNLTHQYTAKIDDLVKHKESELLEV